MKLEGPVSLFLRWSFLVCLIRLKEALSFVLSRMRKKGQLSPPLLGARSLQSSYDQTATYQEVKQLSASATKKLSSFISTNLGEGDSLPVVEHEMGDLPLLV